MFTFGNWNSPLACCDGARHRRVEHQQWHPLLLPLFVPIFSTPSSVLLSFLPSPPLPSMTLLDWRLSAKVLPFPWKLPLDSSVDCFSRVRKQEPPLCSHLTWHC